MADIDPHIERAPIVKPNSEISGGTSVPAATALRLTEAFTAPSTSRETEPVMSDGIAELAGQLTLVLNRFSVPEKLKSCRSCDIVLLNVVAFCNAEGSQEGRDRKSVV